MSGYPMVAPAPAARPERTGLAEIAWAVWLGCTTPKRLAAEWSISHLRASDLLSDAATAGRIERLRRGHYRADPPRGIRDQVGTLPRLAAYAATDRRLATPAA